MANAEDTIIAEGSALIWVLQQDASAQAGTDESCRQFVDSEGSNAGLCVGDGETSPEPGTFHNSPFADGRGFDMVVDRASMKILFTASHGTPSGNDNLAGDEVIETLRTLRGQ